MALGLGMKIESTLSSGYLLDAKQARGGYTVVADSTELNRLSTGSNGVVIVGSLAYNQYDNKFYQYKQTSSSPLAYGWVEVLGVPSNVITYTYNSSTGDNNINLPVNAIFHDDIIPTNGTQVNLGGSDNYFYEGFITKLFVDDAQAANGFNVFTESGSIGEGDYRKNTCTFEYDSRDSVGAIRTHYYHYYEGEESESTYVVTFPYKKNGELALIEDIEYDTAGATNKASTKMYLIGAESQGSSPQTYSNSSCYIGTDNCLYSGGTKVLTSHQDISGKAPNNHASSATTYGVGTSSNYGHMKLGSANQNGATAANGVCAPNGHTHSQYLTSHQTVTTTSKSCSIYKAGSATSFNLPFRYVGSSRVPGTYYISGVDSYGLGTPITGDFVAGDVMFFKEYSGTVAFWYYNGSSWSSINIKKA